MMEKENRQQTKQTAAEAAAGFHIALIGLYGIENTGVRYLSAHLKRAGFKVSTIFFKEWRNNDNHPPTKEEII